MSPPPAPLTIERVLEASQRISEALQLGYPRAVEALLEEIRLVSGAHACQLVEWDEQGEQIVAESRRTPVAEPAASVRDLVSPVLSAIEGHRVAEIRLLLDEEPAAADEATAFAAFLMSGLASLVALDVARDEADRHARESAAATRRTMAAVREAEDNIGNSISVVMGWLRLAADRAQDGQEIDGLSISVRRLEEVQESVARLLAHTQAEAIGRYASERVDAMALLGPTGQDPPASHVWIAANRSELMALLKMEPPLLGDTPWWSETSWNLPIAVPTLLTSEIATAISASGGSLAVNSDGASVSWRRIAAARGATR